MIILVATDQEYELAHQHLSEYDIVKTGVGASNVIRTCAGLLLSNPTSPLINVGFAGSNKLPIGTVTKVSQSFRLLDNKVEFKDYRNGFWFSYIDGVPCYTHNCFVTKSNSPETVIYDMELNYIAAFPIDLIGAVKIVSDNLDVNEYERTVDMSSIETWSKVKQYVDEIAFIRK